MNTEIELEENIAEDLMKLVDGVLDQTDWARIHTVMEAVNWVWAADEAGMVRPTIPMLRATAKRLLVEAIGRKDFSISSGGFEAMRWGNTLSLSFKITSRSVQIPGMQLQTK